MEARGPESFEVYCQSCNVTFPIGTRRCVHCGARTVKQRGHVPTRWHPAATPVEMLPIEEEETGEAEVGMKRRGFFSPVTLMWLVVVVAGAFYRACAAPPS